jgi:hypothetical protein
MFLMMSGQIGDQAEGVPAGLCFALPEAVYIALAGRINTD